MNVQGRFQKVCWLLFVAVVCLFSLVSDGWAGKPGPLAHQALLLPCTFLAGALLCGVLFRAKSGMLPGPGLTLIPLVGLECGSLGMMLAEASHFRRLGYESVRWQVCLLATLAVVACIAAWKSKRADWFFAAFLAIYVGGVVIALTRFPLNYLRSDMLPVISWADARLLQGLNPYATMHVGTRLYDFPYLPGMLLAFLPFLALHADPRVADVVYLCGAAALLYLLAAKRHQFAVAATVAVFLLCPFLQYRHDLYLQPHWFCLVLAVYLQRRGRSGWSALVWGVSCGIYQLSWVIVPFFVLSQLRRHGWREALKGVALVALGAGMVVGPFLPLAAGHIAHNTVGQWNHLSHALADPMNLSYWVTYVVRPADLRWVQALVMLAIFTFCVVRRRCGTQTDMLRWMITALVLFVALNVLVDGYFYLTVLLLLTMYVCSFNAWWIPEHLTATAHPRPAPNSRSTALA